MNIYVAGPLRSRPRCAAVAAALRARGYGITSTWHDDTLGASSDPENPHERWRLAGLCLDELSRAEAMVVVLSEIWPAKGTLWEAGAFTAQALGSDGAAKRDDMNAPRVLWVRPCENVPWPTLFDAFGERSTIDGPIEEAIADVLAARGWE